MFVWFNENINWIFSGVGVAFIGFLFEKVILNRRKKEAAISLIELKDKNTAGRDIIINTPISTAVNPELKEKGIRKQSAAFVYKKEPELKVLLIKSSGRRWIFPKGSNIKGQPNYTTARLNALDEAGVIGSIEKKPFSSFKHYRQLLKSDGEECINDIYFLKVDQIVESSEKHREPTWFTFESAKKSLAEDRDSFYSNEFHRVIDEAEELLSR
jgi:hypothetical protein